MELSRTKKRVVLLPLGVLFSLLIKKLKYCYLYKEIVCYGTQNLGKPLSEKHPFQSTVYTSNVLRARKDSACQDKSPTSQHTHTLKTPLVILMEAHYHETQAENNIQLLLIITNKDLLL